MGRLHKYMNGLTAEQLSIPTVAYLAGLDQIDSVYPEISASIIQELKDQRTHLKLIASENYCSYAVQLAMGNWLTDKYAEGYAHHRFYAGCENVDGIEERAENELKILLGAEYAYVQPHSGADANLVAFWSLLVHSIQSKELDKLNKKSLEELTPDEYEHIRQLLLSQKILGMSLNSGGHLTHGYRHNISSKFMQAFYYDVDPETERIDYGVLAAQAKAIMPRILLAGYSAHPCRLNFAKMREIADSVGAILMVDMAHFAGLVAGKVFTGDEDPIPHAHLVTSTTHKTLRGPRGGFIVSKKEFGAVLNKGCPLVLGGPLPHVMAAKAVAFREANSVGFRQYAQKVVDNAKTLAEHFIKKGMRLVSAGTENHLMILDVTQFGLTGRHAETALREAKLTVNRNAIPFDKNGPWYTSGVRIGTAAITTLGMGLSEMAEIADVIIEVLRHTKPATTSSGQVSKAQVTIEPEILKKSESRVTNLLNKYPLYPEIMIS